MEVLVLVVVLVSVGFTGPTVAGTSASGAVPPVDRSPASGSPLRNQVSERGLDASVLLRPPSLGRKNATSQVTDRPRIVAVYPNPIPNGDPGEFVVVDGPRAALGESSITDGETTVAVPDVTDTGPFVLATDTAAVPAGVNGAITELDGRLALANEGDEVRLVHDGTIVDAVEYERAPEGEVLVRRDDGWQFRPIGATDLQVARVTDVPVTTFLLPDAPRAAIEPFESAKEQILLGGYTVRSGQVVRSLCRAVGRGVVVRVLAEGAPVGGLTERGADHLDALDRCGVTVVVMGGPAARYEFHHAKYAVVDGSVIVLTENWTPSGVGGNGSRGWGVRVDDPTVTRAVARTFESDFDAPDAIDWPTFRTGRTVAAAEPAPTDRFPRRFEPASATAAQVEVVVAPDNAETRLLALLDSAEHSIKVEQMSIGGPNQPLLLATLDAARRGVHVEILLSGAWYVREDNTKLVAALNRRARQEDLLLQARLSNPHGRFHGIHAKGVIVDGDRVVVGSPNWTNHSLRQNREVALVLHGEDVATYYATAFRADWRGGRWQLPAGIGLLAVLAWTAAGVLARRTFEFAADPDPLDGTDEWPTRESEIGLWTTRSGATDDHAAEEDSEETDGRMPYF